MRDAALLDAARDLILATDDPAVADVVEELALRIIEQTEHADAHQEVESVTLEQLHRAHREIERQRDQLMEWRKQRRGAA